MYGQMSSNFSYKTSFMRVEWEDFEKTKNETVRSDFPLKNIFSYIMENKYKFDTICAKNQKEKDTFESVKQMLNQFKDEHDLSNQCLEIHPINEDTVDYILSVVSNELFSEGITWYRIMTFFAFVGEPTRVVLRFNL